VPPAISGQHGDVHTFRVCCRLTRGFALDHEQALEVLADWNARCQCILLAQPFDFLRLAITRVARGLAASRPVLAPLAPSTRA
jgi:hypothetical protein